MQGFVLLLPDMPVALSHRFKLPMHTASDAGTGEVALDGIM